MCVHWYACICVCVYTCLSTGAHEYVYVCIPVCALVGMHMCICVFMFEHWCTCICVCVYICVCIGAHAYVHMCGSQGSTSGVVPCFFGVWVLLLFKTGLSLSTWDLTIWPGWPVRTRGSHLSLSQRRDDKRTLPYLSSFFFGFFLGFLFFL